MMQHSEIRGVGGTALVVAAARAQESSREDHLFNDPFAEALAGDVGKKFLESGHPFMPAAETLVCIRTKVIDDHVMKCVKKNIDQIVILGCGMDTRAFRLQLPEHMHVYEVDFPNVLHYKNRILDQLKAHPKCKRFCIESDLSKPEWKNDLTMVGFNPQKPALWILEGLLPYLSEEQVNQLMESIRDLSANGSQIILEVAKSPFLAELRNKHQQLLQSEFQSDLRFACDDPLENLLVKFGFNLEANMFTLWDAVKFYKLDEKRDISKFKQSLEGILFAIGAKSF